MSVRFCSRSHQNLRKIDVTEKYFVASLSQEAIEVFKSFEKKDQGLIDQAATNLSFLYFLEGDLKNSEKYAELAVKTVGQAGNCRTMMITT